MKVLYVTGACLSKNTSANMSHNGYVQGLAESGAQVEVIMSNDSWGETDQVLRRIENVKYNEFNSVSFKDKIRKQGRQVIAVQSTAGSSQSGAQPVKKSLKSKARSFMKQMFYRLFPNDPVYPLNAKWLKTASKFKSEEQYDLIISNSSPAASHKLVLNLLSKKSVRTKKWIQIWEDPWYYDLYGGHTEAERKEEELLLKAADAVYYVSPLTLMYQKRYFPECADKMNFIPLPAFRFTESASPKHVQPVFGYFGDYYSHVRNLAPFINVAKKNQIQAYIIGDSNLNESSSDTVLIKPRMTLKELSEYQDNTDVLVQLCNLSGGQIPGKIYHYSVTDRKILFILDGTDEEKKMIHQFFDQYNRYCFCENNENDISEAIRALINEIGKTEQEVTDFYPVNIVKKMISENV